MIENISTKNKVSSGLTFANETRNLYRWNCALAIIFALQAIAIFVLSSPYKLPVIANYLASNPIASSVAGHSVLSAATSQLFQVNVQLLVIVILLVAFIVHAFTAGFYRKQYEADLKKNKSRVRWIGFAINGGLILVCVGLLVGVYDLAGLIMVFLFSLIMSLASLMMEIANPGKKVSSWLPYSLGCIAGIVPWIIFAVYLFMANNYGNANIPAYVYWIFATVFVCFIAIALNAYLYYKKVGQWTTYLFSERSFMFLSLVTISLLVWQVYAGVLRS